MKSLVLGIETSCDDSSVAIVDDNGLVQFCTSQNQDADHRVYGGVVPEIASRSHTEHLLPMVDLALSTTGLKMSDIRAIASTNRPGLVGSLMVGVVTGKSLALIHDLPWIGVNHIHAHIMSAFLSEPEIKIPLQPQFPFLSFVVSGGHTHLFLVKSETEIQIIGRTVDDAAGEALDKFGKLVGLGFPGGAKVDAMAKGGRAGAYAFPRPMSTEKNLKMSFSGLKTSALNMITNIERRDLPTVLPDLCASYQEAVVDILVDKLAFAVKQTDVKNVSIVGGVSANSRLRSRAQEWADTNGVGLFIPPIRFSTDNAAMVAYTGNCLFKANRVSDFAEGPSPASYPSDFS